MEENRLLASVAGQFEVMQKSMDARFKEVDSRLREERAYIDSRLREERAHTDAIVANLHAHMDRRFDDLAESIAILIDALPRRSRG